MGMGKMDGAAVAGMAIDARSLSELKREAAQDQPGAVRKASREFIDYFDQGAGKGEWERVHPLSAVIAGDKRPAAGADLTLFKSMGMGISDLSVAMLAYKRAREAGRGIAIPLTASAPVRLSNAQR